MNLEDDLGLEIADQLPVSGYDFPEPADWMLQTDKVIDAYKNEVELMRMSSRVFANLLRQLRKDVERLKAAAEKDGDKW